MTMDITKETVADLVSANPVGKLQNQAADEFNEKVTNLLRKSEYEVITYSVSNAASETESMKVRIKLGNNTYQYLTVQLSNNAW